MSWRWAYLLRASHFYRGSFTQHTEWPGHWLERGKLAADDALSLDSPLGLAGHRVLGLMWLVSGPPRLYALYAPRREIDAQTYCVRADGQLLSCESASVLPMAQRYFLS